MSKIQPASEEMMELARRAERAMRLRPKIGVEEWAERMASHMVREGIAIDRALRSLTNSEEAGDAGA